MPRNHGYSTSAILAASLGAVALGGAATAGSWGPARAQGTTVVINEVQYDPPPAGPEARFEWIELLNLGATPIDLAGWTVADNRGADPLPAFILDSGAFLVVAAGDGFRELFPAYAGDVVVLSGSIGNGLGNGGDQVRLLGPDGGLVDGMSYGSDAGVLDPPATAVAAGHSLERVPAGADSDDAGDWVDQAVPSPGEPGTAPATATAGATGQPGASPTATVSPSATSGSTSTSTPVATVTPRPSVSPTAAIAPPTPSATIPPPPGPGESLVLLNEYLPAPRAVDWNGDGRVDGDDEWVELFNAADVDFDLSGWQLDDIADGGSSPYVLPPGSRIPARGYLLIFRAQSRVVLNNDGDEVRLVRPDASLADASPYGGTEPDRSFARAGDGAGPWTDQLAPTPGAANGGLPTATASVPPTDPARTPAPTPSGGRAIIPLLLVSEVYYDPVEDGNDADYEWVEIHNPGPDAVELAGWFIGDGTSEDELPAHALPAAGFVVVAGTSAPSGPGPPAIRVADGRIGNGLANEGDVVALRSPEGRLADAVSWGRNREAFDPPVPPAPEGYSIERIPPGVDSDSDADWWIQAEPSPGWGGSPPGPPPRVRINEVMPAPSRRDWDGDGKADRDDEWIELHNPGPGPARLAGWRVVAGGDRWSYTLGAEDRVAPGEYRVLYRRRTGLHLGNARESVALVGRDGVEADSFSWTESPGWDRSWSRVGPGPAEWTAAWPPSPGRENRPPSPPSPVVGRGRGPGTRVSLGRLSSVPYGQKVAVAGVVVAPLGLLGRDALYVGDAAGGVRVYAPGAEAAGFVAFEGDSLEVTGTYTQAFGEAQIRAAPRDLVLRGRGRILAPRRVATGALATNLGRLVRISGPVESWQPSAFTLNDGSGQGLVVLRRATGLRRPSLTVGGRITVAGVVGRYARRGEAGGYRLMPRGGRDFPAGVGGPRLPATGAGPYSSKSGPSSSAPGYASCGRGMNSGKRCKTCGGVGKVIQSNPPR